MMAVRIHAYGGPEVVRHEEAPLPDPGHGKVLVRVHAASVNPVDWKTRAGGGQEVFGLVRFPQPGQTYAEYVAAPAHELVPKPQTLSHSEAAAMPLAALTAWQALLETGGLEAGQTALIHAAAGGVGHLAVQLARWKGARVVGTASGANADFLRSLGAEPVDYHESRFEDSVSDADLALVPVDGDVIERTLAVLRPGGVLVSIRAEPSPEQAERLGVRAKRILVRPHAGQLAQISSLVDAGRIRPVVAAEFPLAEVNQAFELSEGGHVRGKIVLSAGSQ
ncbi:MAG: NADP-dependent oxidoreductase [Actinomycetota bacterium]|nr:NADP-dependent oxidoreductase [Actinomycetota bacterium]